MLDNELIRVLIVDDSAVVRGLLTRTLEVDPAITIVTTAMNGKIALRELQKRDVDVVVLDVEMPVMDGLTTLQHIRRDFPSVKVIMASTLTTKGAETTVRALSMGAVACVGKPSTGRLASSIEALRTEMIPLIHAVSGKKPSKTTEFSKHVTRRRRTESVPIQVLVIGASTGGPQALKTVLTGLPQDFPLPILIVQHMPPHFTEMLAKHLGQDTGRPSVEAADGQPVVRGQMYVAPGGHHLLVEKRNGQMVTAINQAEHEHFCRPSVNPLFRSTAQWYGRSALGVMLTGMGDDGIEGTQTLVEQGGTMIAQDEASSVVWGMPGAVVRNELAHKILPLDSIADAILELCTTGAAAT